ncbi:putative transposase [Burkholderia mallei]|nr:putative transposase [Burkholderia mallei]
MALTRGDKKRQDEEGGATYSRPQIADKPSPSGGIFVF